MPCTFGPLFTAFCEKQTHAFVGSFYMFGDKNNNNNSNKKTLSCESGMLPLTQVVRGLSKVSLPFVTSPIGGSWKIRGISYY